MSKFRVNQKVVRKSDGAVGTVKLREVSVNGKVAEVKYLVDFGGGIENWKVVTRKDVKLVREMANFNPYTFKTYSLENGMELTVAARVETFKDYVFDYAGGEGIKIKEKRLTIGYSIYNGKDDYDKAIGLKFAAHRCKENPFTTMFSHFSGEFNQDTVDAIMDAKARYISNNIDKFYRPVDI